MNDQPWLSPATRPVEALGADAEHLYRLILRSRPRDLAQHADVLGWPLPEARKALARLEGMRLARQTPQGPVVAEDPRSGIGRLIAVEEEELDARRGRVLQLRESLESFEQDFRHGLAQAAPRAPRWQEVPPAEAGEMVRHLLRTTEGEVRQMVRYIEHGPAHEEAMRRSWKEMMGGGGLTLRTIFPLETLSSPGWWDVAAYRATTGEQQRYIAEDLMPVAFIVFGQEAVLVSGDEDGTEDYILIRADDIVRPFITLFEEMWRRSRPAVPEGSTSRDDVRLLELLGLGLKDEAIARQLGIGLRTVRRRVAALMDQHGVDTRFQLGLAVARRGLMR